MPVLKDKVALITGAGRGIGRGIALRFGTEGAEVGVFDRNRAEAEQVAAEILSAGGRAVALHGDVSDAGDVRSAVQEIGRAFGPPTVLVHNAAILPTGTVEETSEDTWEQVFSVNVKGAYLTAREVLPCMRRAGGGSIIFMSSISGVNGFPGMAAYSSTKGALISLARAMAIDYARERIRVNCVSPGTVDSPMLRDFVAAQPDPQKTRQAFDDVQPGGRVGTIEEIVGVFVFLASAESTFVTGANFIVDGGMSVKGDQPRL
jgi:NAD(P)-dependent dehydrogenase (short-subunit alcohol dehydrogenase family)